MVGWQVWDEVPVAECLERTGKKPLGSRWVDVNKGHKLHVNYCVLIRQLFQCC